MRYSIFSSVIGGDEVAQGRRRRSSVKRERGAAMATATLAVAACLLSTAARAEPRPFSLYGLAGWEERTFWGKKRTRFEPVNEGRAQVIEARCDNSSSGYIWRERVSMQDAPLLTWRWKIEAPYAGFDERSRQGDDFPARVYVIRGGGFSFFGAAAISYVWSNGATAAEDWVSPYTEKIHVVALRRGSAGAGQWHTEVRDLRKDFKEFFHEGVKEVAGVAIMADCDDHQGQGRAWFADVNFRPAPPEEPVAAPPPATDPPAMTPGIRTQELPPQRPVELPIPVQGAPGYEPPAGEGPAPVQSAPPQE